MQGRPGGRSLVHALPADVWVPWQVAAHVAGEEGSAVRVGLLRGKKRIRVTNSFAMGTILLQVELREPGWVSNGVLFPGCGITSTRGTALECRRSGERIYSLGQHQ